MKDWKEAAIVIGGTTAVFAAIGYVLSRLEPGLVELRAGPPPAGQPPGAGLPEAGLPEASLQQLGEPLTVIPGGRYVAAVDVSFPLSLRANTSSVEVEARKMGFSDAIATKTKPVSPPVATGDFYVTASYTGAPATFPRSNALGQVKIVDAWRIG